jgi:hypothetical protein
VKITDLLLDDRLEQLVNLQKCHARSLSPEHQFGQPRRGHGCRRVGRASGSRGCEFEVL